MADVLHVKRMNSQKLANTLHVLNIVLLCAVVLPVIAAFYSKDMLCII